MNQIQQIGELLQTSELQLTKQEIEFKRQAINMLAVMINRNQTGRLSIKQMFDMLLNASLMFERKECIDRVNDFLDRTDDIDEDGYVSVCGRFTGAFRHDIENAINGKQE